MEIDFLTLVNNPPLYEGLRLNLLSFGVLPERVLSLTEAKTIASGYNELARRAAADILCFVHQDVRFHFDVLNSIPTYFAGLLKPGVLGVVGSARQIPGKWWWECHPLCGAVCWAEVCNHAPTLCFNPPSRHLPCPEELWYEPVQTLDGLCLFIQREVFEKIGGFDESYDAWHGYDMDICMKALQAGRQNCVINQLVHHIYSKDTSGSADEALRALRHFAEKWGKA